MLSRLALALVSVLVVQAVDATRFAPIAEVVEEAVAAHQLPGAVVLVGRGDAVVYAGVFGNRVLVPAPEPMTEDTIFDLASLTKVVATATSVMKLVEEGRIRLNDPVAQFLPEVPRQRKSAVPLRPLVTDGSD